jgi:hypothetical protein
VLSRRLEDRCGLRLEAVVCDCYGDEPAARLAAILKEGPLDAVLLHRSTNTFFVKTASVFVVQDPDRVRYVLHPMFPRRRSRSWLQLEAAGFRDCITLWTKPTPPGAADPPPLREIPPGRLNAIAQTAESRRFRLNDLSWIVADRCGLVKWAIEDEVRIVKETQRVAAEHGLPLIVLGPGLKIGHRWVNRFAVRLDAALTTAIAPLAGVRYASLLQGAAGPSSAPPLDVEHYMDEIHFNAAGHALVADVLDPLLAGLLEPTPAASPQLSPR